MIEYAWELDDLLDVRTIRLDAEIEQMCDDDPVKEEEETLTEAAIRDYHEEGGY